MASDLDTKIAEVEQALHDLNMGRMVARFRAGDEETEWVRPTVAQLETYLAKLKAQKAGQSVYGAIGFTFG